MTRVNAMAWSQRSSRLDEWAEMRSMLKVMAAAMTPMTTPAAAFLFHVHRIGCPAPDCMKLGFSVARPDSSYNRVYGRTMLVRRSKASEWGENE